MYTYLKECLFVSKNPTPFLSFSFPSERLLGKLILENYILHLTHIGGVRQSISHLGYIQELKSEPSKIGRACTSLGYTQAKPTILDWLVCALGRHNLALIYWVALGKVRYAWRHETHFPWPLG